VLNFLKRSLQEAVFFGRSWQEVGKKMALLEEYV
jgi:hypothetical protein